jgi:hypothetical protein
MQASWKTNNRFIKLELHDTLYIMLCVLYIIYIILSILYFILILPLTLVGDLDNKLSAY